MASNHCILGHFILIFRYLHSECYLFENLFLCNLSFILSHLFIYFTSVSQLIHSVEVCRQLRLRKDLPFHPCSSFWFVLCSSFFPSSRLKLTCKTCHQTSGLWFAVLHLLLLPFSIWFFFVSTWIDDSILFALLNKSIFAFGHVCFAVSWILKNLSFAACSLLSTHKS